MIIILIVETDILFYIGATGLARQGNSTQRRTKDASQIKTSCILSDECSSRQLLVMSAVLCSLLHQITHFSCPTVLERSEKESRIHLENNTVYTICNTVHMYTVLRLSPVHHKESRIHLVYGRKLRAHTPSSS